jgi:hypothetical protein
MPQTYLICFFYILKLMQLNICSTVSQSKLTSDVMLFKGVAASRCGGNVRDSIFPSPIQPPRI